MKCVKSGRGGRDELPEMVEGADNKEEIVGKFRTMYSTLYNCADTKPGMNDLNEKIKGMIKPEDLEEVTKVTSSVVKQAVKPMKSRKSDISSGYTSDALLNEPDNLYEHLATVSRSWLV